MVEYYNHPSGSGAIPEMTATYPNSGKDWNNSICAYQSTKVPQLEWTVDRNDSIIYQQCAFFNGVALDAATGLDKDISSGKSNGTRPCLTRAAHSTRPAFVLRWYASDLLRDRAPAVPPPTTLRGLAEWVPPG